MDKLIIMTAEEIRKTYGKDEAKAMEMARAAPEYDGDPNPGGKPIARGFAQFKEHINRKGRPKSEIRKAHISIRLPEDAVASLKDIDGYSAILGDYIMGGIKNGSIKLPNYPTRRKTRRKARLTKF